MQLLADRAGLKSLQHLAGLGGKRGSQTSPTSQPRPSPSVGKKVEPKLAPDAAIRLHDDDHDDSVVAAAWSAHNAWVYASLSYGGRVVVAQVPSAEKYRVLL